MSRTDRLPERSKEPRKHQEIGGAGWVRIGFRGAAILILLVICFPLMLAMRPLERLIWGQGRPVTPAITQAVCVLVCAILGLRRKITGSPAAMPVAHLANHVSWLDIFVLNACAPIHFVAKSEVRDWPGIGWLARGTGTLFIERRREAAKAQETELGARLAAGHRMLIFPEGTSSDGLQVFPFKSTILAAFFSADVPADLAVQPVSLRYYAPSNRGTDFYGWPVGKSFIQGLLQVLAQAPQGAVHVMWLAPIPRAGEDRKSLAAKSEVAVRAGFNAAVQLGR